MTLEKLRQRRDQIRTFPYIDITPIDGIHLWETKEHLGCHEAAQQPSYKRARVGQRWGKPWWTGWFRFRFTLPDSFAGLPAVARIITGGEACAFMDGAPLQGLDPNHTEIRLTDQATGGETFELLVEAGCQGSFGEYNQRTLTLAEVAAVDEELRGFYWDFDALWEVAHALPSDDRRKALLIRGLNQAIDRLLVDGFDPDVARKHAKPARAILKTLLAQPANASALNFMLCGHAHIDVAWLWPLRETVRKCSRTFSTVLKMMEDYPEYRFSQSQPHLYWFTKQHYPELYEGIKAAIKARKWEAVCGMWVEPDMNLTGGESLVRQILLAKRFTKDEFNQETDVLWLPDVFGYCASLPQVLKKAGIDYFATIKIFWNETNRPPFQSFWWEGIDGTRILSHYPPSGDYNAVMTAEKLNRSAAGYNEKDRCDLALFPFGWGDGGGGPAVHHLEQARRYRDLEGVPRCKMAFITDFFKQLEKQSDDLPVWRGELYLETHRGTYTSQANNKKNNRQSELLYREAEFLACLAQPLGSPYPKEKLNAGWRTILLNQFHDILPGSSISQVYEDSDSDYETIRQIGEVVRDEALMTLAGHVDTRGPGTPVLVVNSLPWTRETTVTLELPRAKHGQVIGPDGPVETVSIGGRLRFEAAVPSMGHALFHVSAKQKVTPPAATVKADETRLESDTYRIRFDKQGLIRSIFDKRHKREVLPAGTRANVLQRFQDRPTVYDAWNIDREALDTMAEITQLESVEVLDLGPNQAGLRQVRRFGKSEITQDILLSKGCPLITFDTRVDWNEDWQLLKAAFPVEVQTDHATCEIQFGHVRRPINANTSWDQARYETCAHKWIDLSEPGYGVALLNDCKYGHDVLGNVMRLTLLKSAKEPDAGADMGIHAFAYALMPHAGDFREAEVIRRAYELNLPATSALVQPGQGPLPASHSYLSLDAPNVMIEAVKVEEDGERWIVRLYETHGRRGTATLTCGLPLRGATECDLMERNHTKVKSDGDAVRFEIKPFEIKTFALRLKK